MNLSLNKLRTEVDSFEMIQKKKLNKLKPKWMEIQNEMEAAKIVSMSD